MRDNRGSFTELAPARTSLSESLTVLITNHALAEPAGTEMYVRDLAIALLRRGHKPVVFSRDLGAVAAELKLATVPVVDDLEKVGSTPDIIHGHHHIDTMSALLRFPGVPAIYYCHGWFPFEETPLRFPRIVHYLAVDHTCLDRLVFEHGIAKERITVLLNFVDLSRFKKRNAPLPHKPRKGLVFSNYAEESTHVPSVREACARAGIELDVVGNRTGNIADKPELILPQYDIVFAKAKSALEAMSTGTSVVLCDSLGLGPIVTTENFDQLRALNFGLRALARPVQADLILEEVSRYNADDAASVCELIRNSASHEQVIDELVKIYRAVTEEYKQQESPSVKSEFNATEEYLRFLDLRLTDYYHYRALSERMEKRVSELAANCNGLAGELHSQLTGRQEELNGIMSELELVRNELEKMRTKRDTLQEKEEQRTQELNEALQKIAALENSATMRLRNRLRKVPLLGKLSFSIVRGFSR